MLKRLIVIVLLAPALALAQTQAAEPAGKLTAETIIKRTLEGRLGGVKIDGVAKTPYLGLYEVRMGSEILYTDEKINHIFSGNIIDAKNMQNITEKRLRDLSAIKWENLPLDAAVKTVRGNGKRTLAVFSDPNCPYCKRFEKDLAKVDDVTIYTFLYPILSQDSHDKSRAVWCSADRSKAWSDLMLNGAVLTATRCDTPIEKTLELGRRYRVTGTPTLVFANGERVPGAIPAEQVEKLLTQNGK
ncbi:MAG: DsbC family protein [Betaproteobacteria bacterium]|nr:MAG: DsbC family protein [Betaproteobacteria bacterium]